MNKKFNGDTVLIYNATGLKEVDRFQLRSKNEFFNIYLDPEKEDSMEYLIKNHNAQLEFYPNITLAKYNDGSTDPQIQELVDEYCMLTISNIDEFGDMYICHIPMNGYFVEVLIEGDVNYINFMKEYGPLVVNEVTAMIAAMEF